MGKRVVQVGALIFALGAVPAMAQIHYSSTLSWRALQPGISNTVRFTVAYGLVRSAFSGTDAGDGRPAVGDTITPVSNGEGGSESTSLFFGDGSSQGPLQVRVTSIDRNADWMYAVATVDRTYAGPGPYTASIQGCCFQGGSFQVPSVIRSVVDLTREASSPVANVPPIVVCPYVQGNCSAAVVAGSTETGNLLRYRFATQAESGGQPPAGATIDATTGVVTYTAVNQTAIYTTLQVVVESFQNQGGFPVGTARSSSAIQFLYFGTPAVGNDLQFLSDGAINPAQGPDAACNTSVAMTQGRTYRHDFRPSTAADFAVTAAGVPVGATFSPPLPYSGVVSGSSVFTWTPGAGQEGTYVLSVIARSGIGASLIQRHCSVAFLVYGDADGDGIPDIWETQGYTRNGIFVDLKSMGASPTHKDVFVYIDGYTDPSDTTATRSLVSQNAINTAIATFQNAPVLNLDGTPGISLRVVYGNLAIPSSSIMPGLGGPDGSPSFDWALFDSIKAARFPVQYAPVFRYGLFYPNQGGPAPTSTGISKGIIASDFAVTLGQVARTFSRRLLRTFPTSFGGTDEQQAGTFLHELGHVLGLTHGGPFAVAPATQQSTAYKPNYLSVMNYAYQLTGIPTTTTPVFDFSQYSATEVPVLDEQNLNETLGFQVATAVGSLPGLGIGPRQSPTQRNLLSVWYCQTGLMRTTACRDSVGTLTPGCTLNSAQRFSCGIAPQSSVIATLRLDATPGQYLQLSNYLDWAFLNFGAGAYGFGSNVGPSPKLPPTDNHDPTPELRVVPNAPTGVSARRSGNTVRVGWNPVGASNSFLYSVYKKIGSGAFTLLGDTAGASWNDTVGAGQTLQYYVTATGGTNDANGNSITSANSATVTVVVP